jgi:uncharacterized alpha-E superfamily protein
VRTALTSEMWDTINSAWIELAGSLGQGHQDPRGTGEVLRFVQETSLRFDGSAYRTMLRNDAYWFSAARAASERADNTARILDVKYHVLLPRRSMSAAARLLSVDLDPALGLGADRLSLGLSRTLKPWLIADLLILNDSLPRSLASCYGNLVRNLDQIGVAYGRQGAAPAPRPRRPQSPGAQPHGRYLPARRARIHPGIHY